MKFRLLPALMALGLLASPARAVAPPGNGVLPSEVAEALERGLFETSPPAARFSTSAAATTVWRVPVIRVAFSDSAIVFPRVTFERLMFDTTGTVPTGSFSDYWWWASGGRLRVLGEVVATVTLPQDRYFYSRDAWGLDLIGTPNNAYGMFRNAVAACDRQVDFSRFDRDNDGYVDMLWLVHAGVGAELSGNRRDLWSITSRATAGWNSGSPVETDDLLNGSNTQRMRIDRFTVLPELSMFRPGQHSEIGVYCHEFGHTLGLPDLYDTSLLGGTANVGPGNWSLMSTGAYGGDTASPESPAGLGAWPLLSLGWATRLRPSVDTTLVLRPVAEGGPVVELTFQGEYSPEHFLLENRVRGRFDRMLPSEGLLVQRVDEAIIGAGIAGNRVNAGPVPGVKVMEADGRDDLTRGSNRGDASDPFPGQAQRTRADDGTRPSLRTAAGAPTNLALDGIRLGPDGVTVRLQVRAPGWQSPLDLPAGSAPQLPFGPAVRAVLTRDGDAAHLGSESDGTRLRVVLRERSRLGGWSAPVPIDRGQGQATEPAIARLGERDLIAVWIETEPGAYRLCHRSRIGGRWGTTTVLSTNAEGSLSPSVAVDAQGRVHVAWIDVVAGRFTLRHLQFLYATPFGRPASVTAPVDLPSAPLVTAAGNGRAFLLWTDRGPGRLTLYACRFHPDSGLSQRFTVVPNSPDEVPSYSAVVDTGGVLHTVWQWVRGGSSELHYQRRSPQSRLAPRDTTLDAIGDGLQNPRLAFDAEGGMHLAYERLVFEGTELRYLRWTPADGWDSRPTTVSGDEVNASAVDLLPRSHGDLTAVWVGFDGITERWRERTRRLDGGVTASVPPTVTNPFGATLAPLRNPARATMGIEFRGSARPGEWVDLLDAGGRRVARTRVDDEGRARFAPEHTAPLPPGLYLAHAPVSGAHGRVVVLR